MDLCALFSVCFTAMLLICRERESGAFSLLRSLKKGRESLAIGKLTALFICCVGTVALFAVSGFILSGIRFGFCDLNAPIQSVNGFLGCVLSVNVWQYLLLLCVAKTTSYFIIAILVFALSTAVKNNISVYFISGGIVGIEIALNIGIDSFSVFSPLKYLNIIALTDVNEILGNYRNISFFNYPINVGLSSLIMIAVSIVALIFIAIYSFSRNRLTVYSAYKISSALMKLNPFKKRVSVSLFSHEAYKLLFARGGAVILLVMVLCGWLLYSNFIIYPDESDGYFRQYIYEHGGTATAETAEFIDNEVLRFEELSQRGGIQAELAQKQQSGFDIFCEHYSYAVEENVEIIYDTGWSLLFNTKTMFIQLAFLFAFMSITLAPVYSSDNKIMPLIRSAKKGRRQDLTTRLSVSAAVTVLIYAIAHTPILLKICRFYGTDGLQSPCRSVMSLCNFPINVSLIGYLFIRYGVLLLICLLIMSAMLFISRKMKSPIACTFVLLTVFGVPCAVGVCFY